MKKLFSITAIVALVASTMPTTFGATYSDELQGAYDYAYGMGITTQSSVDNANMYGNLQRSHMAKMMVNYAKEMGKTADTSKTCDFSDVASQSTELQGFIKDACQMGLMGVGISNFNPTGTVTRAEFGTVLSRVLWGDKHNDGTNPYYAPHLNALKEAGVMTNISNPSALEVRGYVMLMMQRADENNVGDDTPAVCVTPENVLACSLGLDSCPAECKDTQEEPTEVKAGDLNVTVADYSASVKSAPSTGTVIFNAIKFASSESVTVNTVTLERTGLSSRTNIAGVWFEKDGVTVSSKGTVATDGKVSINFTKGFSVKSSETLDLVVELKGDAGAEIAFKFVDVNSTAKNVNMDATTNTYRTATYTVAKLTFDVPSLSTGNYKLGEQTEYEFGRFSLANSSSNEDKNVLVKSITLKYNGDVSEVLTNINVIRDGKVVSSNATIDGKSVVISLNDVIESNKKANYIIKAKIGSMSDAKETINFYLNKTTDIVAYEKSTNFRTTNENTASLNTYNIEGGKVVFTNDDAFAKTVEAGEGHSDVVIAKGTLTLAEPVKFDKLILTSTGTVSATGIKSMNLEIGGSRYPATLTNGTVFTFEDIYVSKTSSVRLLVSMDSKVAEKTISFTTSIQGTAFTGNLEYQNSQSTVVASSSIAGAINVAKIAVKEPKFSITNNSSSSISLVKNTATTVTIFDGVLSSNNGNINVNELVLSGTASGLILNDSIGLTLYVNNIVKSTITYKAGTVSFNSIGDVNASGLKVRIDAMPTVSNTGAYKFDVSAKGTDSQGNSATTNKVSTVSLNIVDKGNASISSASQGGRVVLDGSNAELATFDVLVQNGSIEMTGITISGTNLPEVFTLDIGSSTFDGVRSASGNYLLITGITKTLDVGSHTFKVKANMDTTAFDTGVKVTLNTVTLDTDITVTPKNLAATYYFVKAFPIVSLKEKIENEITLEISNTSTKSITLSGFVAEGTTKVFINNQERNVNLADSEKVTINPGQSVLATFKTTTGTVKVTGVDYSVFDTKEFNYSINTTYTNFPWGTFQVTYKN